MNPVHHRLVIYAEDVRNLTGRRRSVAYEPLTRVRKKYKLKKGALVTVKQFSSYTGLDAEDVLNYLKGK